MFVASLPLLGVVVGVLGSGSLRNQAARRGLATTLTFSEGIPLAGYAAYGVTFEDASLFSGDPRLPDDGAGITNSGTPSMAANFLSPQTFVSFTWATSADGVSFFASTYDAASNLLDSFSYIDVPGGSSVNRVASLAGAGIVRVVFNEGGNQIAIDTLNYRPGSGVPDAANTLALAGIAAAGLAGLRRRLNRA